MFFRVSAGWRGRKTAILAIVALGCCVCDVAGAHASEDAAAMKLMLTGLSHKTAPVHMREKFAFAEDALPHALQDLQKLGASEAVIVSTCNRVEIAVTSPQAIDRRSDPAKLSARSGKARLSAFEGISTGWSSRTRFSICSA